MIETPAKHNEAVRHRQTHLCMCAKCTTWRDSVTSTRTLCHMPISIIKFQFMHIRTRNEKMLSEFVCACSTLILLCTRKQIPCNCSPGIRSTEMVNVVAPAVRGSKRDHQIEANKKKIWKNTRSNFCTIRTLLAATASNAVQHCAQKR